VRVTRGPFRLRHKRLRAVLPAVGLVGVAALAPLPATAQDIEKLRVYVVVIDGLNTEEVPLMPFLSSLAAEGTHYPEARSVMIAETTPNHVAMVTGVYPDRNGIVANAFPDTETGEAEASNGQPEQLEADSLFTLVERQCPDLFTAAVTSKNYLYTVMNHDRTGDGQVDADYNFANLDDPTYIPSPAGLTPDERTLEVAREVVRRDDPDFLFVNLGAVDRSGHADPLGNDVLPTGGRPAFRDTLRTITDTNLRLFVEELKLQGTWDSTALLVAVDHSMDWSLPLDTVSLSGAFEADPLLAGEVLAAQNGGAGLYSLRDRGAAQADERLARMREIAVGTDGVDEALYREPNPLDGGEEHWVGAVHPDWHQTSPRSGDLLVTVEDGRRVTEPSATSNPIPGNHGMPSTLRIPMVVAGGADLGVVQQRIDASADPFVREAQSAENIDVAPTVAWLMGLQPPDGGFDGRPLTEAFAAQPAGVCAAGAGGGGAGGGAPPPSGEPSAAPSGAPPAAAPGTAGSRLPATGPLVLVPAAGLLLAGLGLGAAAAARRRP
jgi:ectonucleotide pyrophosphatase/phosphodiesterase family member 5